MLSTELRQKFLQFFKERGHAILPSASLIPENDPSVLFTMAGMHPLVPFFLGEKHPAGRRLMSIQKCVRTGDIDEVGDNRHLTFLEMLGNWSLGDYFKKESITWSFEFLTQELGINVDKLAVTIFAGDADAPRDEESRNTWLSLGIPENKIFAYGKDDNWWPAGGTNPGPQGPCSEIFYIKDVPPCGSNCQPSCSCGRYIEIWNNVFMEFNRTTEGKYEKLAQKNVDTGMGLERTLCVLNGVETVFEIDVCAPFVHEINNFLSSPKDTLGEIHSKRIIADHLRTATFILGDDHGIPPSNVDQGYILRRLIRRAVRHIKKLNIADPKALCLKLAQAVIEKFGDVYPELVRHQEFVLAELDKEIEKFTKTLENGVREFNKIAEENSGSKISGEKAFLLFSSYGFPLELTQELAQEKNLTVDVEEFNNEFKKHQDLSRTASAGKFKGGLVDDSYETTKLHTAAHLLLQSLRIVLGDHIWQKGSNITAERLRFDFSHGAKLTDEEKTKVEILVNEQIDKKLPVTLEEMTLDEAKAAGAMGIFEHKYGDRVKVYSVGDFNKEICGGPHVGNTSELGVFKIQKEEASSAGVRRIKAILQ